MDPVDEEHGRRFFTTSEVGRYCGVSNDAVLRWIRSRKLRAFATPGGHHRVSAEDFHTFLERHSIPIDESLFARPTTPRSVLIVDDDRNTREIVARMLAEMDPELRIEQAGDGYAAGIKIGEMCPDLVVLDIRMPRVDGVALCRSLRENPRTRAIKVIAVTGYPDRESFKEMSAAGADVCLAKPLQLAEFRAEAMRLLQPDAKKMRGQT